MKNAEQNLSELAQIINDLSKENELLKAKILDFRTGVFFKMFPNDIEASSWMEIYDKYFGITTVNNGQK